MIKRILLILLFPLHLFARQIFVSTSGSDTAAGTSQGTAWATISKVNTSAMSGDTVYFNRGNTWYGSIRPATSNIKYKAYGTGVNPLITGFTAVESWSNLGNNIWEGTVNGGLATSNMVSINGVNTAMGRYPNFGSAKDGYLTGESGSNTTTMINSTLTGTPNWTNAEILIRHQDWSSNRGTITAQSTTTLTYTSGSTYAFSANHGFFIQNAAATLDVQNEWYYYDANGTKKIQIYSKSSPTNVKVATLTTLVDMTYTSGTAKTGISFTGIDFSGCNGTLFKNFYANYTTIDSCSLSYAGVSGVEYGNTTSHLTIKNSTIKDCAMTGIYETYYTNVDNVLILNNTVQRIGINAGMIAPISGLYAEGNSSIGIIAGSLNYTVYGNYLDSIGYNGIALRQNQNNTIVRKNSVLTCGIVKNDGGCIYNGGQRGLAAATNVIIDSNICLNLARIGGGSSAGTGATTPHWRGIYLDATTIGVKVLWNFILNKSEGIYLSHSVDCIIQNNQIYGGGDAASYAGIINVIDAFTFNQGYQNTRRNRLVNNVFVTDSTAGVFYSSYNTFGTLDNIGTLDSNFYYNSLPSTYFSAVSGSTNARYSFSGWRTAHPIYDIHSQYVTGASLPVYYYNTTKSNQIINFLGYSKKDGWGRSFHDSYTLGPNLGILLFDGSL